MTKNLILITFLFYMCGRDHSSTSTQNPNPPTKESGNAKTGTALGKLFSRDWTSGTARVSQTSKSFIPKKEVILSSPSDSLRIRFFIEKFSEKSVVFPTATGDYIVVEDLENSEKHFATAGSIQFKQANGFWTGIINFNYDAANYLQGSFKITLQ